MAFFDCDGIRLYLAVPESPEFEDRATIYYRVPDIDGAVRVLEARGVRFIGAPHVVHRDEHHELWMAFFRDTEDNLLALMSEVPSVSPRMLT